MSLIDEIDALRGIWKDEFWGFSKIELTRTSTACPEQYSVKIDDVQTAYFRLRHGEFRVDMPDCGGETVFESEAVSGDGLFNPEERGRFISEALRVVIDKWTESKSVQIVPSTDSTDEPKEGSSGNGL